MNREVILHYEPDGTKIDVSTRIIHCYDEENSRCSP
jgi:hypothetical protein